MSVDSGDYENLRSEAYEQGYDAGRDSTRGEYDDGYNAGFNAGYEEGYDAAVRTLNSQRAPSEFAEPFGKDVEDE